MNSERRHELQENELAAHLGRINRAIEPYSKLIAVVIGAVVLGVIALALYQNKASGERSDATLALIEASSSQDPSDLSLIAANFPNTPAAAWAKLYEGNALLTESMQSLFVDRTSAEESIRQARAAFNAAITMSDDRVVLSRSHFGLARASEALGEIETAIGEYEETAKANESTSMVALVRRRIESLESPETQEFVDWFVEQDFSPADPSLPPSLPSSSTLSDVPDVELPALGAGLKSDDDDVDAKELEDSGLEMPADRESKNDAAATDAQEAEKQDASDADQKKSGDTEAPESDSEAPDNDSEASDSDDDGDASESEDADSESADE